MCSALWFISCFVVSDSVISFMNSDSLVRMESFYCTLHDDISQSKHKSKHFSAEDVEDYLKQYDSIRLVVVNLFLFFFLFIPFLYFLFGYLLSFQPAIYSIFNVLERELWIRVSLYTTWNWLTSLVTYCKRCVDWFSKCSILNFRFPVAPKRQKSERNEYFIRSSMVLNMNHVRLRATIEKQ
jgi:hypothetical protein